MAPDSALARYRPAVLVVAALAASLALYTLHQQSDGEAHAQGRQRSSSGLRRSHAVHRTRRSRRPRERRLSVASSDGINIDTTQLLALYREGPISYGFFHDFDLRRGAFPSPEFIQASSSIPLAEAVNLRREYEEYLMKVFLERIPRGSTILDPQNIFDAFQVEGFTSASIISVALLLNDGALEHESPLPRDPALHRSSGWDLDAAIREHNAPPSMSWQSSQDEAPPTQVAHTIHGVDTPLEYEYHSNDSQEDLGADPSRGDQRKEGQSLLNMLYHIAEDQSRREGYVHRGVSCNSCNAHPIRGIRYRCANCVDFDLCEQCEAMQIHPKTHLFYKIRIPAPYLGNPRQPQPVWYPGKPSTMPNHLQRDVSVAFSQRTGFDTSEVDALWDQFRCLAAVEWPADPHHFRMAIDRHTFNRCFMPSSVTSRLAPTLLIYDRMFAFYDTNSDGLIGFEEFLRGLAVMRSKNPDERLRRVFRGYDHDSDGYVSRKDFLLMFRAFYALTKELTYDMYAGTEDDLLDGATFRENVAGTQPISAAYTTSIPPGDLNREREGKIMASTGELEVTDQRGLLAEDRMDRGRLDDVVGDIAEFTVFHNLQNGQPRRPSSNLSSTTPPLSADIDGEHSAAASLDPTIRVDDTRPGSPMQGVEPTPNGVPASLRPPPPAPSPLHGLSSPSGIGGAHVRAPSTLTQRATGRQEAREAGLEERQRRRRFYLDEDALGDLEKRRSVHEQEASSSARPTPISHGTTGELSRQSEHTDVLSLPQSTDEPSKLPVRFPPPLEEDVGREILYQIKSEGLNEMLDPLFKHREDLALVVEQTRNVRQAQQKELNAFAGDSGPMAGGAMRHMCRAQLQRLQSKWRTTLTYPELHFDAADELLKMILLQHQAPYHPEWLQNLYDMRDWKIIDVDEFRRRSEQPVVERHRGELPEAPSPLFTKDSLTPDTNTTPKQANGTTDPGRERSSQDRQSSIPNVTSPEESDPSSQQHRTAAAEQPPTLEALSAPLVAPTDAQRASGLCNGSRLGFALMHADLNSLLRQAGWISPSDDSPDTGASSDGPLDGAAASASLSNHETEISYRDPTLPQFRPSVDLDPLPTITQRNATTITDSTQDTKIKIAADDSKSSAQGVSEQPAKSHSPREDTLRDADGNYTTSSRCLLKYLLMLDEIERSDELERGGPGRLDFAEFEETIKGPRGQQLWFLGSWIELVNF